jgi:hypothetical protein
MKKDFLSIPGPTGQNRMAAYLACANSGRGLALCDAHARARHSARAHSRNLAWSMARCTPGCSPSLNAPAWQQDGGQLLPKEKDDGGGRLTGGDGRSQWQWSTTRLDGYSAGSCMMRVMSWMSCNMKRRMKPDRHSNSLRGDHGGGATPTRWRSGEEGAGPTGPRAAMAYGDAP